MIRDAYEAIYMAAVNAVASAVNSAINLAKAAVQAIGTFAVLIAEHCSQPRRWIHNRCRIDGRRQ